MFGLHPIDLIVVLVVALLVFGPKKLPEMGSAIGKSIKEFRKGMNELNTPEPRPSSLRAPKDIIDEEPRRPIADEPADEPATDDPESHQKKPLD